MPHQQEPPGDDDPFAPFSDLSDLTGDATLPALEDPSIPAAVPPRSPLLTGLIVALLLIVVSISIFQLLKDDEGGAPVAAATTTTTSTLTPSAQTTGVPAGTATITPAPSETQGPGPTVTVEVPGTFDAYLPVGDAIPIDELRMAVDGIGPIKFGISAGEAAGRLISSMGEPDEDTGPVVSTGTFGACVGQLERRVRWGPFMAIVVVDEDGTKTFGGYRLDFAYAVEGLGSPATELQTLSGLKAAQSVVALEDIYESFTITYEVIADLGTTFQLRSSRTGNLLLWGPVTSDDSTGIVLGIYAPNACGRFQ